MTLAQIVTRIRFLTGTDSTQYSDANILAGINKVKDDFVVIALRSQDELTFDDTNSDSFPVAYFNLTASKDYYTLPTELLKLRAVDISYDGTNYYKALPVTKGEIPAHIAPGDDLGMTTITPYYYVYNRAIWPQPIPTADVTSGLILTFDKGMDDFTALDTTVPAIPPVFFDFLVRGPVIDWFMAKNPSMSDRFVNEQEKSKMEIATFYGSQNKDRKMAFTPAIEDYL